MPVNLINAISKKCKISKENLEEIWQKAKKSAKKKDDWQYIVGVFKKILKNKYPNCYKKYFKESYENTKLKIKILEEVDDDS